MVHKIHIPVMGICYTVDTPMRVAHFGINSVISLVDDFLLEEYRKSYGERLGIDNFKKAQSRVERIRMYLDFINDEINRKFEHIKRMHIARCIEGGNIPCDGKNNVKLNEKDKYFLMLPLESDLRKEYNKVCSKSGLTRVLAETELTNKMEKGDIEANIMVCLNHKDSAIDAVRGFALSKLNGSLVFSAGVNLSVFEEVAKYDCFYQLKNEKQKVPNKKIILKVSDYRSALIQGKYLAKKGLNVYEYRIESGINCGGHAFFESKKKLKDVLKEFILKKHELFEITKNLIEKNKNVFTPLKLPRITAQGGICSSEDVKQVLALGADGVGVGTPFLLVPQATSVDSETRNLLSLAKSEDIYLSHASPLGIPFMNFRFSTASKLCKKKIDYYFLQKKENKKIFLEDLKPGFPCLQHLLCKNIDGFKHPICMASREYVTFKLNEIDKLETEEILKIKSENILKENEFLNKENLIHEKYDSIRRDVLSKECICRFLGNSGREELLEKMPIPFYERENIAVSRGLRKKRNREPISICPSPSIAYFNRTYTLYEMMQHLYGIGESLTPKNKPSVFEIEEDLLNSVEINQNYFN